MSKPTSTTRSRLDPEPVPRRDFLGIASLAAAASAMLFGLVGMLRLPKAAVVASPSKKFTVELPDSLAGGTPFIPPGRSVALFRDEEGVYAVSLICTHLGCIIKAAAGEFECPCHGSKFALDGAVIKGPAPSALPWFEVVPRGDQFVVDEATIVPQGTKVTA
ncbi:MAG: Rieske 2Fe-2S domain-containing protein [Rhodopirellula sp.]|nr:Rieske 2Fe-2S domain-containing protein [Rhodopirellula sp.]